MTALGGTSYSYDRNGNLTAFGSNSLNYDESNKWVSGTVNGNDVAFGYDGHGRRSFRTMGTSRTDHWYDRTGLTLETGANNATFLRDHDGTLLAKQTSGLYIYGHNLLGNVTALLVPTTSRSLTPLIPIRGRWSEANRDRRLCRPIALSLTNHVRDVAVARRTWWVVVRGSGWYVDASLMVS